MYFIGVKNQNNNITIIPAIDLKLKFDSERTIDSVEFKTISALNYYSNIVVYISPFVINLNTVNPVPAIYNFELPINESQHSSFVQSFSSTLLTSDVTMRGNKLNGMLNVLASPINVSTFSVYATFLSTRNSTIPIIETDGNKFVVYWERSNQRFRIVYNNVSYYVPMNIDSNTHTVFVNAVFVINSDNQIYVYANDYAGNILSGNVAIQSISNFTFNSLTVYGDVYNFWFFTYPLMSNVVNSLSMILSAGKNQKNVLKTVYTFIVNNVKQINPRLYEISGYSSGYKIHGSQVVNIEFKNKRVDEIMENLIMTHTDLTVLNFIDISNLTPINYVANGSLFIILNDLATRYNITFFTIHNFVVLTNNVKIDYNRQIDSIFVKPQLNKSDFDKYSRVINSGVSTEDTKVETFTGNGTTTTFQLKFKPLTTEVSVNSVLQELNVHYKIVDNTIIFTNPPQSGATISVKYTYNLMITATADKQPTSVNVNTKRNYLPYPDYQTLVLMAVQDLQQSTKKVYQFIFPTRFDLRASEVYTIKFKNYYDYHIHIYNESFTELVNNVTPAISENVYAVIGYQYNNVDFVKKAFKLDGGGNMQYNLSPFDPSQNWLMRIILKTETNPSNSTTIMTFGNCSFVLNTNGTIDVKVGATTIATLPATTDWRVIIIQYLNGTYSVYQNLTLVGANSTASNITTVNSLSINAPCIFDSFIWIANYTPVANDVYNISSNTTDLEFNVVRGTLRAFDYDGRLFNVAFVDFDPNLIDIQQRITKRLESLESLVLRQTNLQNSTSQVENIIMSDLIQMLATSSQNNSENVTISDASTPSNHRYNGGRTYDNAIWDYTLL
jgi:hypothetical protein